MEAFFEGVVLLLGVREEFLQIVKSGGEGRDSGRELLNLGDKSSN